MTSATKLLTVPEVVGVHKEDDLTATQVLLNILTVIAVRGSSTINRGHEHQLAIRVVSA